MEVSRFLAVGLVATIVALILFNFLVHGFGAMNQAWLNGQPEIAYVIANGVGMVISFRGMKFWAFRDRASRHADGGVIAFVVINLATMLIPITCLWISRGVGLDDPISDNISANVIGLVLANAARFFLFREFVFQRVHHDAQPAHLAEEPPPEELAGELVADLLNAATETAKKSPAPPPVPGPAAG